MSPYTFELKLFDTTRTGQLVTLLLLGITALVGVAVWIIVQLGGTTGLLLGLALLGGGGYAGWRAYKQAAVVPAVVTLTATELRVEDLRPEPRLSQTLRLADITTYRYSNFNNTEELRLNRADAPPLLLRSTGALAPAGNFSGLLVAFEQAMGAAPNPSGVPARREKSFFEKPISTYLLVAFTLVLAAAAFGVFASAGRVHGNIFGVVAGYIAYVAAWRAASARRNAS